MVHIRDIYVGDDIGHFRANAEMIGWKSDSSGEKLLQWSCNVRQAEWLEGELRVLCEDDTGDRQVMAFSGFAANDFETLWLHFSTHCGVYIKRRKAPTPVYTDSFDTALKAFETAADLVDEAPAGTVVKKAREADFLIFVERMHNGLEEAVKGDKHTLRDAFAANGCERIGRLRLVFDTVRLDDENMKDARWRRLHHMIKTVESVLQELGGFHVWRPSDENTSMSKRQTAREIRDQQISPASTPRKKKVVQIKASASNRTVADVVSKKTDGLDELLSALENFSYDDLGGKRCVEHESVLNNSNAFGAVGVLYWQPTLALDQMDDMGVVSTKGNSRAHYTRWDSVREGWIWKKSRFLGIWRKRWFVLTPAGIEFLVEADGSSKRTEFMSPGSMQKVYKDDSGRVCVVGDWRSLQLSCDDVDKLTQLVDEISKVLCGHPAMARGTCWSWY
jgi:hypothetical protein